MERSDNSHEMTVWRDFYCSLLMLLVGLFFCFPLATLVYFTYQTISGSQQFCTLWTDVPGRLAILLICYYIGSMCGFLPLPQRYHLHGFIVPFNVWNLRSWSRLIRNMCFPIPYRSLVNRLQRNVASVSDHSETPLLQANNQEGFYTYSPRRRPTSPINIPYPESHIPRVFISNPETSPMNETPGIIKDSNGSIISVDPSVGDILLPIMPEKSFERHYRSESASESESSGDHCVPVKYKRFTEIKRSGEVSGNDFSLLLDRHSITRERPENLTSDKKSRALADDERLAIARRQERQGLAGEIPDVHIEKDLEPVHTVKTETDRSLNDKNFEFTDKENLVSIRQEELRMSDTKRPKNDPINDRLIILTREERFPETNDQPTVHEKEIDFEGVVCSNREAQSEYPNSEGKSFPGTRNKNHQSQRLAINSAVSREQSLDKYFDVTDDEGLVTTKQKELQISGNENLKVHTTGERLEILAINDMLPGANDHPTVHERNIHPEGLSSTTERGTPSENVRTEALLKFPGAYNRNQLSRRYTVNNEQEIPPTFHSTEAQMNFPETPGENQQLGGETANSERKRVIRFRSNRLNFPLFPWLILKNSKVVSSRERVFRKKNLDLVNREMQGRNEGRNRQFYLGRALPVRCMLPRLRAQRVNQTHLPRCQENINILGRNSFRTEKSSIPAKSCDKLIEAQSNSNEDNVGLTTNRYEAARKQGRVSMNFCHAMNLRRSLVERATLRRRQLPSLRFQAYEATRPQIRNKTSVKRSVKLEKCVASDQKDPECGINEISPSNLCKPEERTVRTGMVTIGTGETANGNCNELQLSNLRQKLAVMKQDRKHVSVEASTAVESKQIIKNNDIGESNVSTKSSKEEPAKNPYVKIIIDSPLVSSESDEDSDPEQSK